MRGPIILTGAGGDIGIAVGRCLREIYPKAELIGADCRRDTPAEAIFDRAEILPLASDSDYLPTLEKLAVESGAKLLLPLAEAELATLMEHDLLQGIIGGARLITANAVAVAIGLDKIATNRQLREAGCPVPESGIVGEDDPEDFPVIIKPRRGQGSKGIQVVERDGFGRARELRRGDLWQRLLPDADEEYTCGITRFPNMPTRVISFRRRLAGGLTGSGEVVDNEKLEALGRQVAEAIELRGSVNMQLRLDKGVPMIFEINPRFSSTVRFRHLLGYRDVAWSIEVALGEPVGPYSPPRPGTRIFRVAQEIVLPPA